MSETEKIEVHDMLFKYMKSKCKPTVMFLIYLGIFCLIAYLYNMPADALLYAAGLCLFFAGVFLVYSYARFRQKQSALKDVKARIMFGPEELPPPSGAVEEEYQEIIRTLYSEMSAAATERDNAASDMLEYYTMWVHQIKTPIAAMRLLLQSEGGVSRDEMQMELFKVEQYVEMALQYMRLGSETTDFVIKKLDLDRIVRDTVKKYSTIFIKKKIALDYSGVDTVVISDEKWLGFVLEQILSNALKYTHSGKISVYMDRNLADTLVIEDTGIGIQAEDLPRVFDKGYTGYNGRKDKKSTGIGLYLCRRIMDRLGHTLSIESEVGRGTRVKLGLAYKSVRFE